jgi:hypothetical protein
MRNGENMLSGQEPEGTRDEANDDRADEADSNLIGKYPNGHADELCGVLRYVAHKRIDGISARKLRAARHISIRLQRAQERHHIRLVPLSNRTWSLSPCQRRQCPLFRCKVRLGIDVGRIERHMSEPSPDRIDVNARLQKMAGGRVSDDMRTDPLPWSEGTEDRSFAI